MMAGSNRPLQNPKTSDFVQPSSAGASEIQDSVSYNLGLAKYNINQNPQQLSLVKTGYRERFRLWWGSLLDKLKRREEEIGLSPYWHSIAPTLSIVTSFFLITISALAGLANFKNITQSNIPFYFNSGSGYWQQADKSLLLILPLIFLMSLVIITRLNIVLFRYDPRLSRAINFIVAVVNILFLIGLNQLYSLIVP